MKKLLLLITIATLSTTNAQVSKEEMSDIINDNKIHFLYISGDLPIYNDWNFETLLSYDTEETLLSPDAINMVFQVLKPDVFMLKENGLISDVNGTKLYISYNSIKMFIFKKKPNGDGFLVLYLNK